MCKYQGNATNGGGADGGDAGDAGAGDAGPDFPLESGGATEGDLHKRMVSSKAVEVAASILTTVEVQSREERLCRRLCFRLRKDLRNFKFENIYLATLTDREKHISDNVHH